MDVKIKNSSPKIFIFGFFSVYLQCWNEATQPTTTSLTTKQKINEEETHRAGLNIKHLSGAEEKRKLRFSLMLTRFFQCHGRLKDKRGMW